MAILFSQADGSDQHYDTYDEFEQAFVLLKRLNGEKVPQDLLDEVKDKYDVKDPTPIQVVGGDKLESAFREAVRELTEALVETSKDRTPVSDESENPEKAPKFVIGDKVKVVENKSGGHVVGTIGEIGGVSYIESQNRWSYEVNPISGHEKNRRRHHSETDLNNVSDSTEFRDGDFLPVGSKVKLLEASDCGDIKAGEVGVITEVDEEDSLVYEVRVRDGFEGYGWVGRDGVEVVTEDSPTEFQDGDLVRVTESFRDSFGDVAERSSVLPVITDGLYTVIGVGTVLIGDNLDKLRLVCRKEDRKDVEL